MGDAGLLEAFRAGLTAQTDARALDDPAIAARVASELGAAWSRGARAWPTVRLDDTVFARHVAARLEPGVLAISELAISELAIEDLYLACALATGDAAAIRVMERELLPQIVAVLARRGFARDGVDDVAQSLREHLLVGTVERRGRIADFRGRGSLRSWIIVAALRMGGRAGERARREAVVSLASVADPRLGEVEAAIVKQEYRERLEHACEAALMRLPQRERTLLRLQLVDGASIDQIGRIYGVHRATAARWLARARADVLAATRTGLADALGVDASVAAGIAELVQSQLDISVARLLQTSSS